VEPLQVEPHGAQAGAAHHHRHARHHEAAALPATREEFVGEGALHLVTIITSSHLRELHQRVHCGGVRCCCRASVAGE
jgi:hypothetical protein